MKNVFVWLENLKKQFDSTPGISAATDEEVANFNKKFAEIKNFNDFTALLKEVTDAGNATFVTAIDGKPCVLGDFKILIQSAEKESKFSMDHAMNQSNPENVIRYFIYDQKVIRIRSRMCNVEMLKKSLKVVAHNWEYYNKFASDLYNHFNTKVEEINTRSKEDRYRSSMLDRTLKSLERAKELNG